MVVQLFLKDRFHILIEAEPEYLRKLKKYFTFKVPNYFWNPKFRSGMWDGTTCLLKGSNVLPYGLLFDFIKIHKTNFPDIELNIDKDVKSLFNHTDNLVINYDLKYQPRDYQQEIIEACLKYTKCIAVSATASGKSLMIAYILKILRESNLSNNQLIIVPTTSLVEQFYNDLIDYGIKESLIGKVYSKEKSFNKNIVISTWQSLANNHDMLELYDCLVCDEVHRSKSHEIAKIIKKSTAKYRFGFTGTLPNDILDVFQIKSYLGPVVKTFTSGDLSNRGYISKCNVNMIYINYNNYYESYTYNDLKDILFNDEFRLEVIKEILKLDRENYLVLVGKVEKEGEVLKKYLEKLFPTRDVVFLSGKDDINEREHWRNEMSRRKNIILIGTFPLFQEGVNFPSLKYIIFAAPYKSKIRIIQSIGRSTRKFKNKIYGSYIFDIVDKTKYFNDHGNKRHKHYMKEGFTVREIELNKGDNIREKISE